MAIVHFADMIHREKNDSSKTLAVVDIAAHVESLSRGYEYRKRNHHADSRIETTAMSRTE